jgi:hypothetical protein
MSNAKKKVIVRRFAGEILPGYLPLLGLTRDAGGTRVIDVLDLSGRIVEVPLRDVKTVCYVRDFNLADTVNPERLTRRAFLSRPRNEGVWIRMTFRVPERFPDRTPETLEGLTASDLSLVDSLLEDCGIHFAPPDIRSNTQRIFVPRAAIDDLQILAVITTPSRLKPAPPKTPEQIRKELQDSLFDAPTPSSNRPN